MVDIQHVIAPLALHSIFLDNENGHRDGLNGYIKFVINNDPTMQRWNVDDKEWAIRVLTNQANGR